MKLLLPKLLCATGPATPESLQDFRERLLKVRTEGTNADLFQVLHDLLPDPVADTPELQEFKESLSKAKTMTEMFWIADKLLYEDDVREMITQLRNMQDTHQRRQAFAHARTLLQMKKLQQLTLFLKDIVQRKSTEEPAASSSPAGSSTTSPAASSTTSPAASSTTSPAASSTTSPAASSTTSPAASSTTSPAASPARRRVFTITDR
jgi:hypothetical protein